MKPTSEVKILKNILEIIDNPDAKERSCRRVSAVFFLIGMLCLFFLASDNLPDSDFSYVKTGVAFVSGLCFGLGFWFVQMGFQTTIVTRHLSRESIDERIEEIST